MIIYFEPHASSLDNEAGLASGHFDVELSEKGWSEAKLKRKKYSNLGIEAVYTSDLKRAYKTAEIIFEKTQIQIVKDIRLRECDYGVMTRRPRGEIIQVRKSCITTPFPYGESYFQVITRVKDFLEELLLNKSFYIILIIGHFAILVGLEYWLEGRQIVDSFQIEYNETEFPLCYQIDEKTLHSKFEKDNQMD